MDLEKDKVIPIDLDLIETNLAKNETTNTGKTFWTTDIGTAYLNFSSTYEIVGSTASLVLQNLSDGSDIQRTIEVGYNHFFYMLREDEIRRAGNWIGQIVIEKDGKALTSRSFKFTIKGALLDSSEPSLSSIDNYNKFYEQLGDLKTEMSAYLVSSEASESARQQNEASRKTEESKRVAAENVREENYESKVDTAIVEADVVEKVDNKVAELAPTIQQVTAQLAQTKGEVERKRKLEDLDLEVLSAIEGGEGTSFNLLSIPQDKSVTPKKTTFFEQGYDITNLCIEKKGFTVAAISGSYRESASELEKILYIPISQTGTFLYFSEITSSPAGRLLIVNEDFTYVNNMATTNTISNSKRHATYPNGYYAVAFPLQSDVHIFDVGIREFKDAKVNIKHDLLQTMTEMSDNLISCTHPVKLLNYNDGTKDSLSLNSEFSMSNIFPFDCKKQYKHNFNSPLAIYPRYYLLDSNFDFVAHVSTVSDYSTHTSAKYACIITDTIISEPYCSLSGNAKPKYFIPSRYIQFNSKDLLVTNYKNSEFSALGDSLTAGNGTTKVYHEYVKEILELGSYQNCGIGGTFVSGDETSTNELFWKDSRINSLNSDSDWVTIMGGTNDSAYRDVGEISLSNEDVLTFAGAYNVMLSKIFYKYLKLADGYYTTIDYTGVVQREVAKNIKILLITPPKRFDTVINTGKSELFADAVISIAKLWGLPVVDGNSGMQMNVANETQYFGSDKIHFNVNAHINLASLIVGKLKSIDSVVAVTTS